MKKIKQFLTMFLVIILSCTSLGSSAYNNYIVRNKLYI